MSVVWRCGDIPSYLKPGLVLIKDKKMKIYAIAGFYRPGDMSTSIVISISIYS